MESSIPAPQESPIKRPSQAGGRTAKILETNNLDDAKKEHKKV